MKTKPLLMLILLASVLVPNRQAFAESYWLKGGLYVGGVGVVAGGLSAFALCGMAEENKGSCRGVAIPVSMVVVGATGFGLGALIGSAFEKDKPVANLMVDPKNGTYGATIDVPF